MSLIQIDHLSVISLSIQLKVKGKELGFATGFVVEKAAKSFLITNWHVASGRHPDTDKPSSTTLALPDELIVAHHQKEMGRRTPSSVPLYDSEGKPRWIEHPRGREIDVVAIPLDNLDACIATYPLDLSLASVDMEPKPGMPVFVIGFPLPPQRNYFFPIWKTGHIASDHDLDFDRKPAFLIDATTRGGMSGSPVVMRMSGGFHQKDGMFKVAGPLTTRLLGVYSGRVNETSELGIVWRPTVIEDILQSACHA